MTPLTIFPVLKQLSRSGSTKSAKKKLFPPDTRSVAYAPSAFPTPDIALV